MRPRMTESDYEDAGYGLEADGGRKRLLDALVQTDAREGERVPAPKPITDRAWFGWLLAVFAVLSYFAACANDPMSPARAPRTQEVQR